MEDLRRGVAELNLWLQEKDILALITELDRDKVGAIPFPVFREFAVSREKTVHTMFNQLDLNGDGYLTPKELGQALKALGLEREQQVVQRLVDRLDPGYSLFLPSVLPPCFLA